MPKKGQKHSESAKRKMSKAKKGKKLWPNGREFTKEWRGKISLAHKGKIPKCVYRTLGFYKF